ncbi:BEM_collapsed_G0016600.mRNA.1.CDS.1 [Saccharomyces cerevisiae]|nr:BEM_collapsed_G0016600.mRNA.1.CDS.1 [Saccharomyces cerevisiae]
MEVFMTVIVTTITPQNMDDLTLHQALSRSQPISKPGPLGLVKKDALSSTNAGRRRSIPSNKIRGRKDASITIVLMLVMMNMLEIPAAMVIKDKKMAL